ncbi:hypothetical protein HMPREF0972_02077 [Actinomyces sp. oral taxon 848 str. F0332]|nr:hypothetical protein HMPREF0972_02077 [Actinomyces sp. oral taxon 848 str. F0332]
MCVSKEFYALCLAANVGPAPTASWKPLRPWKSLRRRRPPAFCAMPTASERILPRRRLPILPRLPIPSRRRAQARRGHASVAERSFSPR